MPRPGVDVIISDAAPIGGAILDTGQAFMLGVSERGPTDTPLTVRSLRTYERWCGGRGGGITAHDAVRAFFTEGGSVLYFMRLAGANAVAATGNVTPLAVTASSAGTWGNALTVGLEADVGIVGQVFAKQAKAATTRAKAKAGNGNGNGNGHGIRALSGGLLLRVVVRDGAAVVERSPLLSTADEAITWANANSSYIRLAATNPAAALEPTDNPVALSGGTDDPNIGVQVVRDALARFGMALGPGQVIYPGATDPQVHGAILDYCDKTRRCALLDLNDTDEFTVASDVLGLHGNPGARFAAALAPRIQYMGPAPATTVLVPYSAIQAGLIARRDRATGNPNEPAAGTDGYLIGGRALGLEFTDDVREELNEAGVTLARARGIPPTVYTYGSRTCAGPGEPNWQWFGGSRVVMAIAFEADDVGEQFVHRQIDGQGRLLQAFNSALTAVCDRYFALGALFGENPEDAYQVDTGPGVNTPQTINAGEIHAHIRIATSPPGEYVLIEIMKNTAAAIATA